MPHEVQVKLQDALETQIKAIFDLDKVTFDHPGESMEQECAFIDVKKNHCRVKDAREVAKLEGTLHIFAQVSKLPLDYFGKCIDLAAAEDKRGLVFLNPENRGTFGNIAERTIDFVFLFDSQYDPNLGTFDSIEISVTEN